MNNLYEVKKIRGHEKEENWVAYIFLWGKITNFSAHEKEKLQICSAHEKNYHVLLIKYHFRIYEMST